MMPALCNGCRAPASYWDSNHTLPLQPIATQHQLMNMVCQFAAKTECLPLIAICKYNDSCQKKKKSCERLHVPCEYHWMHGTSAPFCVGSGIRMPTQSRTWIHYTIHGLDWNTFAHMWASQPQSCLASQFQYDRLTASNFVDFGE
jgi:hypothetical protein